MVKRRRAQQRPKRQPRKRLRPKTINQEAYIVGMAESHVTFCTGPAGSGKTAVAVGLACEYILSDKIDKIVITRPVVESGHGLGYLPGSVTDKIQPYLIPIMEEMKLYLTIETLNSLRSSGRIELCPLEYMRGRNFHNSFMILDEAQNATYEQIKMFITRIGTDSKAVINGDIDQTDLPQGVRGGLLACIDKLADVDGIAICPLTHKDIVRNDIIARILSKL
tara:strand:- start:10302 stop:10967 length:666 start_codon:yes stop_codon:yes gene_type:complete